MPDIYINTERPIDRAIVAGINQPQREAPIGAFTAGSSYDVNLYFVKNDGTYDAASGDAGASVQVSISTLGKPQSGTFTLTDGIDTTTALEYGATALEVQTALNALNSGAGAFSNQVAVEKVNDQQYAVTFATLGAVAALSGSTVSLYPESTPTASIAVAGSATTNAQQIIEITRQPAVYDATWSTIANGFTGTLALNTTRLLQSLLIDAGMPFYIEVKLNGATVAKEVIGIEPSTMPASAFSATGLATLLDLFAANPNSNAGFDSATWNAALSGAIISARGIIFDTATPSTGTDPGEMRWNDTDKCIEYVTENGVVFQLPYEQAIRVRNSTGVTIPDGAAVRILGSTGNRPNIVLAQSNTAANVRGFIGLATEPIANNADGVVTISGLVRGIDTSAYAEGAELYIDAATAGELTDVEPAISVQVGTVTRSSATQGTITVTIISNIDNYKLASNPTTIAAFDADAWTVALRTPTTAVTTSTHTVTATDTDIIAKTDSAGGGITITVLPAATAGDGYRLPIVATGSSGDVTISGATINSDTSAILPPPNSVTLLCDGSEYYLT